MKLANLSPAEQQLVLVWIHNRVREVLQHDSIEYTQEIAAMILTARRSGSPRTNAECSHKVGKLVTDSETNRQLQTTAVLADIKHMKRRAMIDHINTSTGNKPLAIVVQVIAELFSKEPTHIDNSLTADATSGASRHIHSTVPERK